VRQTLSHCDPLFDQHFAEILTDHVHGRSPAYYIVGNSDIEAVRSRCCSPRFSCCNIDIVQMCIDTFDSTSILQLISSIDTSLWTSGSRLRLLHTAARCGDANILRVLIDHLLPLDPLTPQCGVHTLHF
jgi:hypothetical protein